MITIVEPWFCQSLSMHQKNMITILLPHGSFSNMVHFPLLGYAFLSDS